MTFYSDTLNKIVSDGLLSKDDSVIVLCAGKMDRDTFHESGFTNVVITNLDYHSGVKEYDPFVWEPQDAESIDREDDSVDWAVVHAGLHHCASPHHALCEMLRVSRKGVLVFESRDSLLIRLSVKLGFTVDYELEPVVLSGGKVGGLRDTLFPNYIYRWTEREVRKTVSSYIPHYKHSYSFYYGYRLPIQRLAMSPSMVKRGIAAFAKLALPFFNFVLPKQGNSFGFLVRKNSTLQDWMTHDSSGEPVPDMKYLSTLFDVSKYQKK